MKTLIFLIACVCIAFLSIRAGVFAGPAVPNVSEVIATDPMTLEACSTVVIWCNTTVSDDDGWTDIETVNATLWDPASTTQEGSDDNSTHYTNTNCTLNGGSGSTVNANCSFALAYHANPAEWACRVYANDTSGNVGNNTKTDVTINTLRALGVESTINFDSLAPGATSPDDVNNTVTNCGNVAIDLNLSGTDLTNATASITNISVNSVKYNVTDPGQDYATGMTPLSATPVFADFTLTKRTNGESTKKTYWKISIPSTIEKLVYAGVVNFTAVDDT